MARFAVLQHFWCEHEGVFGDALREEGHECVRIPLYEGAPLPHADDYDGWLFMGGPMNVDDVDEYPFLLKERDLIRELVERDVPVLGICLGCQLIARAMGGRVYPGRPKEIGLFDVQLTEEGLIDPVVKRLGEKCEVLQWHGDTYDLPENAVQLARSDRYEQQAFRLGKCVYGLQFHLECTVDISEDLRQECVEELAELPEKDRFEHHADRLPSALGHQNEIARTMIRSWADLMRDR